MSWPRKFNGLQLQTFLSAPTEAKGFSGALTNLGHNQPQGQELPTDEFGTGLIEKLVSRGALRHPCLRNFSTIGGELAHDLLVEPNIHR